MLKTLLGENTKRLQKNVILWDQINGPIANVLLRGTNLVGKFIISLYLARFTSSAFLGEYVAFATAITVGIYILGLEYYAFSNREYLESGRKDMAYKIRNQVVFHFVSYVIFLPISYILVSQVIPRELLLAFYVILVLEHANQELYRLLIVMGMLFESNINILIRGGFWIFVFIGLTITDANYRTMHNLCLIWGIAELICLGYSIFLFRGQGWRGVFVRQVDWAWMFQGIKVCCVFFLSGVMQKSIEYSERFYLNQRLGAKSLGAYFFYYNIAYIPYIFFSTVVLAEFFPKLTIIFNSGDRQKYCDEKQNFHQKILKIIIPFYVVSIIFFYVMTNWFITDNAMIENREIFWILLIASSVTIVSDIQYLELYLRHLDIAIMKCFMIAIIVQTVSMVVLVNLYGLNGAAVSKLLTSFSIFYSRSFVFKKFV